MNYSYRMKTILLLFLFAVQSAAFGTDILATCINVPDGFPLLKGGIAKILP